VSGLFVYLVQMKLGGLATAAVGARACASGRHSNNFIERNTDPEFRHFSSKLSLQFRVAEAW
jgi:hypothetical protein